MEIRHRSQWHAAMFVRPGHDHEFHNCYFVEHSIATHPTDGETTPTTTLTYERAVPSVRKCTPVSSWASRSRDDCVILAFWSGDLETSSAWIRQSE
jgi:hypothetical protein